jgi:APA family basic amino acid/polyamine antiporter
VLFFRDRGLFSQARLVRDSVVASLAFAYSVWAIWGSGQEWLAKGFMLLLFGIPVFVFMKWRQSKVPVEAELRAFTLQRPLPPAPKPPRRTPVRTH